MEHVVTEGTCPAHIPICPLWPVTANGSRGGGECRRMMKYLQTELRLYANLTIFQYLVEALVVVKWEYSATPPGLK